VAQRNPGWKTPVVFGWAGMRGVVSLAAALSIPLFIQQEQPFPYRNVILVITFVVILVTLVFQGLTLPWLMQKLKVTDDFAEARMQEQELMIRKTMAEASLRFLDHTHEKEQQVNEHLKNLAVKLKTDLNIFQQDIQNFNNTSRQTLGRYHDIYLTLLDAQRKALHDLNHTDEYDEELIRKYLSLVDLEETKLREVSYEHESL
jgi:CPA1 family monovalent cation:H+ antiporter